MYCPDAFAETRPEILRALIQSHPLATLVSTGGHGLEANHIPLYLASDTGSEPVLQGHVARANPLWQEAHLNKVVPTWTYVVIHAYGPLQVRDDPAWIRQQMSALTVQQEKNLPLNRPGFGGGYLLAHQAALLGCSNNWA